MLCVSAVFSYCTKALILGTFSKVALFGKWVRWGLNLCNLTTESLFRHTILWPLTLLHFYFFQLKTKSLYHQSRLKYAVVANDLKNLSGLQLQTYFIFLLWYTAGWQWLYPMFLFLWSSFYLGHCPIIVAEGKETQQTSCWCLKFFPEIIYAPFSHIHWPNKVTWQSFSLVGWEVKSFLKKGYQTFVSNPSQSQLLMTILTIYLLFLLLVFLIPL